MPPLTQAYREFAIVYVLAMVAMIALALLLSEAGLNANGLGSIVPLIVAVFFAGNRHGQRAGRRPAAGVAWRFAGTATAIAFGLSLAALGIAVLVAGQPARAELSQLADDPATAVLIVVVLLVFHLLLLRFLFPIAASQGVAARDRRRGPDRNAD